MAVKIKGHIQSAIHVTELEDGVLAIITEWPVTRFIGTIVQKFKDCLIAIDAGKDMYWELSGLSKELNPKCQVQVLPKGTLIEVV